MKKLGWLFVIILLVTIDCSVRAPFDSNSFDVTFVRTISFQEFGASYDYPISGWVPYVEVNGIREKMIYNKSEPDSANNWLAILALSPGEYRAVTFLWQEAVFYPPTPSYDVRWKDWSRGDFSANEVPLKGKVEGEKTVFYFQLTPNGDIIPL
jgi:hypothetical protein